jgi:hypothetical protein
LTGLLSNFWAGGRILGRKWKKNGRFWRCFEATTSDHKKYLIFVHSKNIINAEIQSSGWVQSANCGLNSNFDGFIIDFLGRGANFGSEMEEKWPFLEVFVEETKHLKYLDMFDRDFKRIFSDSMRFGAFYRRFFMFLSQFLVLASIFGSQTVKNGCFWQCFD